MNRLFTAIRTDVTVQVRNKLYTIGIVVALIVAVPIALLAEPAQLASVIPALMIIVTGGTTLLYVAGMIIFEKDEGTIHAVIVSPLRSSEYLWSKIITLTFLGTLESLIMIGGGMVIMGFSEPVTWPNIPLLLAGIIAIGVIYTLIGIVLVVRYDKITEFLIPMAAYAVLLQVPFLYFWGVIEHEALLLIPTSAPTMLMRGAFVALPAWEWAYGVGYTVVLIGGLVVWAHRAFNHHIIKNVG